MIHYHGTPCGGKSDQAARFISGRNVLIPFKRPDDVEIAADVASTFIIDNSAFSYWKQGVVIEDWGPYYAFVREWCHHPAFNFAFIPDVVDGTEEDNDELIKRCELPRSIAVPVWHFHESLERLDSLCEWPIVALGSSGQWPTPCTDSWWRRMGEVMGCVCIKGRPRTKLYGLRMLAAEILERVPLSFADSTNVVRNSHLSSRYGMYAPPSQFVRMVINADRIESIQSPACWTEDFQQEFSFKSTD